jgi:hypothetical protein
MKNLISYVIQEEKDHKHFSEILEIKDPPYSFSHDPVMHEVMEWMERKKAELKKGQELVLINVFKI